MAALNRKMKKHPKHQNKKPPPGKGRRLDISLKTTGRTGCPE